MTHQAKIALFAGTLESGFALRDITSTDIGKEAVRKLIANGTMVEAILIQDPRELEQESCADEDGEIVVVFGSLGNGIDIYGPFSDSEVASSFGENNRGDFDEFTLYFLAKEDALYA